MRVEAEAADPERVSPGVVVPAIIDVLSFPGWSDPVFCSLFVFASVMGSVLNYAIFLCTTTNSALTTTGSTRQRKPDFNYELKHCILTHCIPTSLSLIPTSDWMSQKRFHYVPRYDLHVGLYLHVAQFYRAQYEYNRQPVLHLRDYGERTTRLRIVTIVFIRVRIRV